MTAAQILLDEHEAEFFAKPRTLVDKVHRFGSGRIEVLAHRKGCRLYAGSHNGTMIDRKSAAKILVAYRKRLRQSA